MGLVVVVALAARVAFEWQEVWDLKCAKNANTIHFDYLDQII